MCKNLFGILLIFLTITSCGQSNEEKAKAMAADYLKTELVYYNTYKPVITEIDSLFYPYQIFIQEIDMAMDLYETTKNIAECNQKIQKANRDMVVYKPTIHPGLPASTPSPKYINAELEKEKQEKNLLNYTTKAEKDYKTIRQHITQDISDTFDGWVVYQKFKVLDLKPCFMEYYFVCNREFSHCAGYSSEDFEICNEILSIIYDNDEFDTFLETFFSASDL